MSTDVIDRSTPTRATSRGRKVTQARVIVSEWVKLRSLRSTLWTLGGAAVALIVLGVLIAYVRTTSSVPVGGPGGGSDDPTATALAGVTFGQLAIGVLGVLVVTGEYSTGMIRATLTAVPKRLPVLWAKAIVFSGVTFVVSLVSVLIAFFGAQAILAGSDLQTTFGADGVARALVGAALYLTVVGLLGIGLGGVLRSTAGAIAALFAILLVVPVVFGLLPASWNDTIGPYLPNNAGQAVMTVAGDGSLLSPWAGLAVFVGYAVLALGASALKLVRQDA